MQPIILQLGAVVVFLLAFVVAKLVIRKHPERRNQIAASATALAAICFALVVLGK